MSYTIPGSPCPVFVAGIKYRSIFEAANEAGINQRWLNVSVKENNGAPVIIKNQFVVTEFWVKNRVGKKTGIAK